MADKNGSKASMAVKVYLVLQRDNIAKQGEPNVKIFAARLTRSSAQNIVNEIPGTWIEKVVATKSSDLKPVSKKGDDV